MPCDEPESDTGERDIPTAKHFLSYRPLTPRIVVPPSKKCLNRRGRAIARIMSSHDWKTQEIAYIFGVSDHTIRRMLVPKQDRVENDYDYADGEFRKMFPPMGTYKRVGSERAARSRGGSSIADPRPVHKKSRLKISDDESMSLERRHFHHPPRPSFSDSMPLAEFLDKILGLGDLLELTTSAKLARFAEVGLTVNILRTMANWPELQRALALRRLLGNTKSTWLPALDWFEISVLATYLRRIKDNEALQTQSIYTAPSLENFLSNVHGLDLSAHSSLFDSRGLTLELLRARPDWEPVQLMLMRQVNSPEGAGSGLSPVELVALEMALRASCSQHSSPKMIVVAAMYYLRKRRAKRAAEAVAATLAAGPRLPEDLEREIFLYAAQATSGLDDRDSAQVEVDVEAVKRLVLVAKRTRDWLQPLLFRSLILLEHTSQTRLPALSFLLSSKSADFWAHGPRSIVLNVAFGPDDAAVVLPLLKACTRLERLTIASPDPERRRLLLCLTKMTELKRLTAELGMLFDHTIGSIDLSMPGFPGCALTHLSLLDELYGISPAQETHLASQLYALPELRYLALYGTVPASFLLAVLPSCPRLRLLVNRFPDSGRTTVQTMYERHLTTVTDVRFVIMPHGRLNAEWEEGDKQEWWDEAERFVEEKKQGMIDASRFWTDENMII
uniref:Uncharacterized protein n=1 Tax=Mycena chlorophos TaxID=658473 RepID=A0ABQ0LPC3_MYCCL|nr:predicted protein [Mycena chlorophos]